MFNLKKITLLITMLTLFAVIARTQDIIIKNDKTEIKSKVTEISETVIKYKKWDNLDGPVYNIVKEEVFMIVYANGQREIIKKATENGSSNPQNHNNSFNSNNQKESSLANQIKETSSPKIDTAIDYKNIKVKYKSTRLNIGFESPISVGTDQEFRIVKNILNMGIAYNYTFPLDEYVLQSNFGFIYASVYAPVNRLLGNYQKQDIGLFVFGQVGYGATSVRYVDFDGKTQSETSGGFTWRFGADFYITRRFGITMSSYEFKSFYGGIALSLL